MFKQGMQANGVLELRIIRDGVLTDTRAPDYRVPAPGVEAYVIGRTDNNSSYEPDIDLALHGAQERGVSRRHAVLVRYKGLVQIIDLDSVNGTFINSKRLSPQIPYNLNSGDRLSLANLDLLITRMAEK
ncbi:MAG: FHA domain-containing protein [Chitinophagaceae bacterium]|nr:FHA domain-containing protein [Anaerolineae bacterium]